jgi:hypothetical protein
LEPFVGHRDNQYSWICLTNCDDFVFFDNNFITYSGTQFHLYLHCGILSHLYSKQEVFQRKIFQSGYRKQKVQVGARTLGRVRSGELGSLVNGTIMVATLIALIIFHRHGLIKTPDAVISFFAVRMISSNLNSLASGLMRHARALVNSSLSTVSVTRNSPLDESV